MPISYSMVAVKKICGLMRPAIFEYNDYRSFLKDWFSYLKDLDPKFSVRKLARDINVSSSYFPSVMSSKIPLRERIIPAIAKYTQLNRQEEHFLTYLVEFNEAKDLQAQSEAFKKISRFSHFKTSQLKNLALHQYFSSWHYVAIRELIRQKNFKTDPKWIKANLIKNVPLTDIKEALNFLVKYGMAELDENGDLQVTDNFLECEGEVFKLALTEYYKQTFDLGIESIYSVPRDERHLASHTVSVSDKEFQKIKSIINKAHKDISEVASKSKGPENRVYHIGLHSFPLSKKSEGSESK